MKVLFLIFGIISYLIFLIAFLYAFCFVGNITDSFPQLLPFVPKTIDHGGEIFSLGKAVMINVVLLGIFAVQHSVMARPAFKKVWTKFVSPVIERSVYVLFSSLALKLMFYMWAPMPETVWNLNGTIWGSILCGLFFAGWITVLISTFLINHFHLFGLQQVWDNMKGTEPQQHKFKSPFLYKWVRHPIYFGFLVGFWATPEMSQGHLLFAIATTGYIIIGASLEERDLITYFGDQYREYKRKVSMLFPFPPKK